MPITTEPSTTAGDQPPISFEPFRLLPAQRLLLEGDTPVRLGSRAFDVLAALVERAGEVVGKEELIARAWPQTFVEDANLKIQVSALRRARVSDGAARPRRSTARRPQRGANAQVVEQLLQASAPRALRPAEIREAMQQRCRDLVYLAPPRTRSIGKE